MPKVLLFSNFLPLCLLGSQVHVSKVSWTGNATEFGEASFSCSLDSPGSTASLYSVTWYWGRGTATATANATATTAATAGSQMLVHLQYDGLLQYGQEGSRRLQHCYRSSPTNFILKLHRVEVEDAGMYWCRVTEWQQHGHPGKWINQASGESQRMVLRVLHSGNVGISQPLAQGPWHTLFPSAIPVSLVSSFLLANDKISNSSKKNLLPLFIITHFNQQGLHEVWATDT